MTHRDPVVSHLERRLGLSFTGAQTQRMLAVVERCRDRAGVRSNDAYWGLIDRDPAAFDELVDALTVGETHFFREPRGLALLQHEAFPELASRRQADDPIQVWSAGCATGEEAYTIAMTAAEAGLGRRVQVLGTDVSSRAIAKAEEGVYGRWSLRGVDADRQRTWFRQEDGRHHMHQKVRDGVRFRTMNLLDGAPGRFDVVVCRNVLMYFTPEALQRAGEVLYDALRPGGWLLTSVSDPSLAMEGLERSRASASVYRRMDDPPVVGAAPEASQAVQRPRVAIPAAQTRADPVTDAAATIKALGGAGRADDALTAAMRAIDQDPLDPELHYLTAVLHLEAGRSSEAVIAARAALFLDPRLDAASIVLHECSSDRRGGG